MEELVAKPHAQPASMQMADKHLDAVRSALSCDADYTRLLRQERDRVRAILMQIHELASEHLVQCDGCLVITSLALEGFTPPASGDAYPQRH